jgi:hypothetical protein
MSATTSRRAVLAGVAGVPALRLSAIASGADVELHKLWLEYVAHYETCRIAHDKFSLARATFEAELPERPAGVVLGDHWRAHKWLAEQHNEPQLYRAFCKADGAVRKTIEKIATVEAVGLKGVAIKLAAMPYHYDTGDQGEAVYSVLKDIDRLLGGNFASYTENPHEGFEDEEAA